MAKKILKLAKEPSAKGNYKRVDVDPVGAKFQCDHRISPGLLYCGTRTAYQPSVKSEHGLVPLSPQGTPASPRRRHPIICTPFTCSTKGGGTVVVFSPRLAITRNSFVTASMRFAPTTILYQKQRGGKGGRRGTAGSNIYNTVLHCMVHGQEQSHVPRASIPRIESSKVVVFLSLYTRTTDWISLDLLTFNVGR